MSIVDNLRTFYRTHVHSSTLDKLIYNTLDGLVNFYSAVRRYHFPANYIRRWKLDLLDDLYEKETMALVKQIVRPGMIVVDIGAHVGYFTRIFSNWKKTPILCLMSGAIP